MTRLMSPDYLEKLRIQAETNSPSFTIVSILEGMSDEEKQAVVDKITKAINEAFSRHMRRPKKHIIIKGVRI